MAAAALSAAAGYQTCSIWRHLPGVQLDRLDPDQYSQALQRGSRSVPLEAQEGSLAASVSALFTAAMREPASLTPNRDNARQLIAGLRRTQVGRLQLAAFAMVELERAGTPTAQWWPMLQPLLTGLDRAPFSHHLADLVAHRAAVFRSLGFGPGSARVEAEATVGHPHGPFLQYLVPRLQQVAAAQRAVDLQSAEVCCRVVRRLLQQWVLEAGPVGLRLLAADLLAQQLESTPAAGTAAADTALAARLRAWRAAYHQDVAARPVPVLPLSVQRAPELCPVQYRALVRSIAGLVWSGAATVAAALVTLLCLAICRRTALTTPLRSRILAGSVLVFVVVIGIGLYWADRPAETVAQDLRRFGSEDVGWPRAPVTAGGLTVGLLALAAVPRPRVPRGARLARVAGVATGAWLGLSSLLFVVSWIAEHDLKQYERHVAAALQYNDALAVTANPTAKLLVELEAWQPNCPAPP